MFLQCQFVKTLFKNNDVYKLQKNLNIVILITNQSTKNTSRNFKLAYTSDYFYYSDPLSDIKNFLQCFLLWTWRQNLSLGLLELSPSKHRKIVKS